MRLVLPIEVRTGADRSSSVHAGSSSRWVATSRLGIEGVRLHNRSWAGCWELLRVAASSNKAFDSLQALEVQLVTGLRALEANPALMKSIAGWEWIIDCGSNGN